MKPWPMPTDFQIFPPPALRCVNGEPYRLQSSGSAAFFARLRLAEHLVIASGPQPSVVGARTENRVQWDLRREFRKELSHA